MPLGYDHTTIERVQQALDIVDVISDYVKLIKKGREYVGICPFHDDHRPSMNVSPNKQIFKCFSCGMGGDVIKFVQMQEKPELSPGCATTGRAGRDSAGALATSPTATRPARASTG